MPKERFRLKSHLGPHSDHLRPLLRAELRKRIRKHVRTDTSRQATAQRQAIARRISEKALARLVFPVEQEKDGNLASAQKGTENG